MEVPFGAQVLDRDGKDVGTVSKLVVHPQTGKITGVVVHQGEGLLHLRDRRDVIVPTSKLKAVGPPVQVSLAAAEMGDLEFYHEPHYRAMADSWEMPVGYDNRSFFLVGGAGWTEAELRFEHTSADVAGTPRWIDDRDTPHDAEDPGVAPRMHVYDNDAHWIGVVSQIDFNPRTRKVSQFTMHYRFPHGKERVVIPARMVAHIGDRVVLNVSEETLKGMATAG